MTCIGCVRSVLERLGVLLSSDAFSDCHLFAFERLALLGA